jgi:uncharacterized protein
MFCGRKNELLALSNQYKNHTGSLVVVYGRRRIGKSALLKHFSNDKSALFFEGLEKQSTPAQLRHFGDLLKKQMKDNKLVQNVEFKDWNSAFDVLTSLICDPQRKKNLIIVMDEFQWIAAGQSKLVSLLKFYWDNSWHGQNVMIILCGSTASYMVKKVIRSKALYGRVSLGLHIGKMTPSDAKSMLNRRSKNEVLRYLMLFGGVPKYLEMVDQSKSFDHNVETMFFKKNALFNEEFEKIFYSHFRVPLFYQKIIRNLLAGPKTLAELSEKLKTPSGGGFSGYLENLVLAGFIRIETPFLSAANSKNKRYRISDEFLLFFSKFLEKNRKSIEDGAGVSIFRNKIIPTWEPWLGLSFENFCVTNALLIANAMGFGDRVVSFGPLFMRGKDGYQIDLLFERADRIITLCEIKYYNKAIGSEIIPEILRKAALFKVPRGSTLEYALIAPFGADKSLESSGFFHHIVALDDFFGEASPSDF